MKHKGAYADTDDRFDDRSDSRRRAFSLFLACCITFLLEYRTPRPAIMRNTSSFLR